MVRVTVIVLSIGLVAACGRSEPDADSPEGMAASVASLLEADRAFARLTAARGVDGWVEVFAEDGVMFRSGGTVSGRSAIRDYMAPVFADTTFSLTWEPQQAHAAEAGDLGYTIGRYESGRRTADGEERVSTGSYVTIWRRQPTGVWRVALDIGTPDDPPSPGN